MWLEVTNWKTIICVLVNKQTLEIVWRRRIVVEGLDKRLGRGPIHVRNGFIENGVVFREDGNIKYLLATIVVWYPDEKFFDRCLRMRMDKVSNGPLSQERGEKFVGNLEVCTLKFVRCKPNMSKDLLQ